MAKFENHLVWKRIFIRSITLTFVLTFRYMSFRQRIKAATQPYHDQTEQLPTRSVGEFTLADYQDFLLTSWLFHRSLEHTLADFLPDALKEKLQWPDRQKTPRLEQDLDELGADYRSLSSLPYKVRTVPEALGAMYVAEGSTLGGMMMKKQWEGHPTISKHSSFAFLGCYGKHTGARWKSFIEVLEASVSRPMDEEVAIASAQSTFEFYQTCHHQVNNQPATPL